MSTSDYVIPSVFVAVLIFFAGAFFGSETRGDAMAARAAETQCARYHPDTGKFEWLE